MEWTDRYCRSFHRLLSRHALLYSEMVAANAVIHGPRDKLLGFDAAEQPVALQLGGNDPKALAQAARIGADWGYAEINLNCGCPSDRVQGGAFGACLMREGVQARKPPPQVKSNVVETEAAYVLGPRPPPAAPRNFAGQLCAFYSKVSLPA